MISEELVETIRGRWERRGLEIVRRVADAERDAVIRFGPDGIDEFRWFVGLWELWSGAAEDAGRSTLDVLDRSKALADFVSDLSDLRRTVARRARQAADRSREAVGVLVSGAGSRLLEAQTRLLYQTTLGESALVRTVAHEVVSATAWGQQAAARSTGLPLVKTWRTVGDERVRPSHAAASGQTRRMEELYLVGGSMLSYPGDPSGPVRETINCRCYETYRTVDVLPPRRGLGSFPSIDVPADLLVGV